MPSFRPTSEETLEDQRRYTRSRLTPVACLDCRARVGVQKNSVHHTSIQWDDGAVRHCPELAQRGDPASGRARHEGCPRLAASIDAAAREGTIPVGAEDGY